MLFVRTNVLVFGSLKKGFLGVQYLLKKGEVKGSAAMKTTCIQDFNAITGHQVQSQYDRGAPALIPT